MKKGCPQRLACISFAISIMTCTNDGSASFMTIEIGLDCSAKKLGPIGPSKTTSKLMQHC